MRRAAAYVVVAVALFLAALFPAASSNDVNCEVCRAVSDAVERVLVLNSTSTDTYGSVARHLCKYLPNDLRHTCEDSIRQLPQSMYRCLVQEASLNTVCSDPDVGICKVPTRPLTRVRCQHLDGYVHTCAACKFVVGGLEHYALSSLDDMVESLVGVCMVRFRNKVDLQQCEAFVRDTGASMIRVVASRIDAQDFCCAAGICDNPPLVVKKIAPHKFDVNDHANPPGPVTQMFDAQMQDHGGAKPREL